MLAALQVAAQVDGWLDRCDSGRVHSCFARACNLAWGENLISLVLPDHGMVPGGIAMAMSCQPHWGLRPGEPIRWDATGRCLVAQQTAIALGEAPRWQNGPPLNQIAGAAELTWVHSQAEALVRQHGRGELARHLRQEAEPTGWGVYALPLVRSLQQGLLQGDHEAVALLLPKLVGLGEGLTPSCDDLLIGLMAIFHFGRAGLPPGLRNLAEWLGQAVAQQAPQATTAVSANYLRLAAVGGFSQRAEAASKALALASGQAEPLVALLESGHSSGTDTLIGMMMAIEVVIAAI